MFNNNMAKNALRIKALFYLLYTLSMGEKPLWCSFIEPYAQEH